MNAIENRSADASNIPAVTQLLPPPAKFQRRVQRNKSAVDVQTKHPKALASFSSESNVRAAHVLSTEIRRRYNKAIGVEIERDLARSSRSLNQEEIQSIQLLMFGDTDIVFAVDIVTQHVG